MSILNAIQYGRKNKKVGLLSLIEFIFVFLVLLFKLPFIKHATNEMTWLINILLAFAISLCLTMTTVQAHYYKQKPSKI